jgi:N-acetylglutamate synthase-like GNAT family acetyltransferase
MKIRAYIHSDRDACIGLFKSNMPYDFLPSELPDFINWLDRREPEQQATAQQSFIDQYFVAEADGRLTGCGGCYIDLDKKEATMTWGMVDRSLHKQGIGRALLQYRIDFIKAVNPDYTIVLNTTQFSAPFFKRMGFSVVTITKDFYSVGFDRYDMIL